MDNTNNPHTIRGIRNLGHERAYKANARLRGEEPQPPTQLTKAKLPTVILRLTGEELQPLTQLARVKLLAVILRLAGEEP
ncbi:hypothetical protein PVK06_048445 [Gossypium arboreum]|uniref:Uncharacterized protein n=1 Tax=Gossypium arboreum TaxID=29729 RepID=A0ABR0MFX2_GOSAR|nr:hypothetical protein PVK06_048445 [Gossypium arboreum]